MRSAAVHAAVIIAACLLSTTSICAAKGKVKSKGTLDVKAALVYRMGGPQPVARQKFYLLDMDFDEIYERNEKIGVDAVVTPLMAFVGTMRAHAPVGVGIVEASIEGHVVAAATSDFEGHVSFKDIPVGSYFFVGMTLTRTEGQFVLWNLPVTVKSKNEELLISQDEGFVSESIYLTKAERGGIRHFGVPP